MKHFFLAATATTAIVAATAASAATITVTGITGTWVDVVPSGVTISNSADNGTDTSSLRWGTPSGQSNQSGYDFTTVAPGSVTLTEEYLQFEIADFTHLNFPISGTSLQSADLQVVLTLDVDGTPFSVSNVFSFAHDETTNNSGNCPSDATPCDDFVSVTGANEFGGSLMIGDVEYFLQVEGFKATSDSSPVHTFRTVEGQTNSAGLWVSFRTERELQAVPLPAGGFLLLSGVGALAVARKRRKAG